MLDISRSKEFSGINFASKEIPSKRETSKKRKIIK
jgi:hypothetical protein